MKKLLFVKRKDYQIVEEILKKAFSGREFCFVSIRPGIKIFNHRFMKVEVGLTKRVITF